MFDVDKIEAENPLPTVAGRYIPDLKPDGKEFKSPCPFHDEKDPSFSIYLKRNEWRYHCFGCGATGDTIGFVMDIEGIDFKAACEVLGGEREPSRKAVKRRAPIAVPDIYDGYTPLPIPEGERLEAGKFFKAWNPKRVDDPKRCEAKYKPSMVFPYRDASGELIGYVIRQDTQGGRKLTPTIRWVKRPDDAEGWCHYGFDAPRPLYGSDRLNRSGQVLVVEGEKCADAGMRLMDMPTISWHGGANAVDKADWSKLAGRKVVLMCDADESGERAMQGGYKEDSKGNKTWVDGVAQYLATIALAVKVVGWDHEKPLKWDIANAEAEGLSKNQVLAWIKERVITVEAKPAEQSVQQPESQPPVDDYEGCADDEPETGGEPAAQPPTAEQPADTEQPTTEPTNGKAPFKILGYNLGNYFYFPDGSQQIVKLPPASHRQNDLIAIAPLQYWMDAYPSKVGVDWPAAANALMHRAQKIGVFSGEEDVRGRGAWIDEGQVVIHTGPKLLINGHMEDPGDIDSKYVYERCAHLGITKTDHATNKEAHRLVQISERLTWESPLSGALLAGWCVIAPVCGILEWRPHVWITGQRGSGKTTVMNNIVKKVISKIGLYMDGGTTEAGIRQTLNKDARPIILDEFESEDRTEAKKTQSVLTLARRASSGAAIIKGSTHGEAKHFIARSCFCFSSINTAIKHAADASRSTPLVLVQNRDADRKEHYKEIKRDIQDWFTPEFSARMFSRTLKYIDVLMANCATFIDAADLVLGEARAADQIGPMLAGYYLCHKTDKITKERAVAFIEENNWDEHTALNSADDASCCLEVLTSQEVRMYVTSETKERHFTIGSLILIAVGGTILREDASEALKEKGVIADRNEQTFTIANKSKPLDDIYRETAWSSGDARKRQFKTLPGAVITDTARYFGPAIRQSRGVCLPVGLVEG